MKDSEYIQPLPHPEIPQNVELPQSAPEAPTFTPEQIEQKKIEGDPTLSFLREQGFEGDPKIQYSLDVVTAKSDNGINLVVKKSFTNYEDLQNFIKDNPEAVAKKDFMDKIGVAPYKTDYDQSVYDWSSKLSPEQSQKLTESFDRFADKTMDIKNFEKAGREKTPDEIGQEITRMENQTLSRLNNPELPQTIGEQNEVDRVVRTMAADARQFSNPDEKLLAGMAEQDLQRLNEHLTKGSPEDLLKADQLLGGYVNRSMSHKLTVILNRPDISIPWEEKEKMLNISMLSEKIQRRQDGMRTRELLAEERNLDIILKKYQPKNLAEQLEQFTDKEKEFQAVVPRGWTTLKHGTNRLNWGEINPYTSDRIKLERPLSVISQEDFERDQQTGGQYDTTKSYSEMTPRPEGMSDKEFEEKNKPFEMRIVFYQDHARHSTDQEYAKGLDKKTMDEIAKYYFANIQGGRHPLVPKGESLIKLGQVQENGKEVFYFAPESMAEVYSKESGVEIKKPEESEGKEEKENPFNKALNSKELAEALNIPSPGYTERKGVAAMSEVFQGLYPDSQQLAQRLENITNDYQTTIETSTKKNPEKQNESHRIFANKKVMERLSPQEKQAIEIFLDKNYQKMGGSGKRMIAAELPFYDFLNFVGKIKN